MVLDSLNSHIEIRIGSACEELSSAFEPGLKGAVKKEGKLWNHTQPIQGLEDHIQQGPPEGLLVGRDQEPLGGRDQMLGYHHLQA
jgi:hypothetical protein